MQLTVQTHEVASQCRGTELQPQKQQSHVRANKGRCLRLELRLGFFRVSSRDHDPSHRMNTCISYFAKQLWCQNPTERHHNFFIWCTYGLLKTLPSTMQYTAILPLHPKSQVKRQRGDGRKGTKHAVAQDLPSCAECVLMVCNQLPGSKWDAWRTKESTNQAAIANGDPQMK